MSVSSLVVLGAGELGGALARHLAALDLARRVVIVDEAASIAAGKALDIFQAAPVERFSTTLEGTGDLRAAAGARVVFLADRAGAAATEWHGDQGLALLRQLRDIAPEAVIMCAGAQQLGLVEIAVSELGIDRRRILGAAPEALRAAVTALVALEAGCAPADISLSVVGRPPFSVIVPWDEAAIAGRLATSVLSAAALARLDTNLGRLWPPGPLTLGAAAARIAHTALTRAPRLPTAYVVPDRLDGPRTRGIALPVALTPAGVQRVVVPSLTTRDRVRLETALAG
jgi:malate dehydrogenase